MSLARRLLFRILDRLSAAHGPEVFANALTMFPRWLMGPALAHLGVSVGHRTKICTGVRLENLRGGGLARLKIGEHCYIGCEAYLDLTGTLVLEDEVTIGPRATILTHVDLGDRPLAAYFPRRHSDTILRRGCMVGAGALVMGGVEVGEGAMIAAGAVVSRDVPSWTVVAGVPARPVRTLRDTAREAV